MSLIWHELLHLVIGIIIGYFLYKKYGNWRLIILSILISLFLDIDHYFDFLLANNFSDWRLLEFLKTDYFHSSKKVYVLFHGWEYVILLLIIGLKCKIKKWKSCILTISFVMFGHLLLDQFSYSATLFAYSLIWRIINDFNLNRLFLN